MNLLAAACFLLPSLATAGAFTKSHNGTAAANFLSLGAGARAMSLGEAYSAVADDATSLYWNPAAMPRVAGGEISLMHATFLDSGHYDYASLVKRLGPGAWGLGVQYFSHGSIQQIDDNLSVIGEYSPSDVAASAGAAYPFEWFSVGVGAKLVRSTIIKAANTGAVDFGLLSPDLFERRLRLALAVSNLGGNLRFNSESYHLPTTLRAGLAWNINRYWAVSADAIFPRDGDPAGAFGTEVVLDKITLARLALRAGYNSRTAASVDGISGLTAGFGVSVAPLSLDYAFLPFGSLGMSHLVSLSWKFGAAAAAPQKASAAASAKRREPEKAKTEEVVGKPADRYLEEADAYIAENQALQARWSLETALGLLSSKDPRRIRCLERLAHVFYQQADRAAAKQYYSESLKLAKELKVSDAHTAEAYAGLGFCFLDEDKLPYAERCFKAALKGDLSEQTRRRVELELGKINRGKNAGDED